MFVLDASALLAYLHDELGGAQVESILHGALISTVNWSEVAQKSIARLVNVEGMREELEDLGVVFEPFTMEQASKAASLWAETSISSDTPTQSPARMGAM